MPQSRLTYILLKSTPTNPRIILDSSLLLFPVVDSAAYINCIPKLLIIPTSPPLWPPPSHSRQHCFSLEPIHSWGDFCSYFGSSGPFLKKYTKHNILYKIYKHPPPVQNSPLTSHLTQDPTLSPQHTEHSLIPTYFVQLFPCVTHPTSLAFLSSP